MYAYRSLTAPRNTSSGVAEYVLLAPVSAFLDDGGIKCPAAPFTNPGDEVTIKQAHQFKTGEGFIKVQLAPQKNKLDGSTIGDRGFAKLDLTLEVVIPGSYAELHEAVKNWLNQPLVALIKDAECKENMYYQLGCDCASAWFSTDFTTGTTADGIKGYTGKLNYQNGYVQVYMGPTPTIKGNTVVTPSFDTTISFSTGRIQNNTTSGISAVLPVGTSQADLDAFKIYHNAITTSTIPPLSGLSVRMDLVKYVNGARTEVVSLTTQDVYVGKQFDIVTPDLVHYLVTFANGDVTIS